jgi:fructosamine kinase
MDRRQDRWDAEGSAVDAGAVPSRPLMPATAFLAERLSRAGIPGVVTVEPVSGGLAALAGMAHREDAPSVFVKAFAEAPDSDGDTFVAEAEGLAALRDLGGLATPEVIVANQELLVLSLLRPRPRTEAFWEQFAHALAHLHRNTIQHRSGWHRDNWLGRRPQINTWATDGFAFFAECRLLRWLPEPRVEAALEPADRAALERLCHRLPELLPDRPACLTHGDLWATTPGGPGPVRRRLGRRRDDPGHPGAVPGGGLTGRCRRPVPGRPACVGRTGPGPGGDLLLAQVQPVKGHLGLPAQGMETSDVCLRVTAIIDIQKDAGVCQRHAAS